MTEKKETYARSQHTGLKQRKEKVDRELIPKAKADLNLASNSK